MQPFLKWAGGKRWLVSSYSHLFPNYFHTFYEPFLGGAAAFFHLKSNPSVLSDVNGDLINTYTAIKEDWKQVYKLLKKHQNLHSNKYYYLVRNSQPRSVFTKAAKFIYLNRTCWNGLYRVNLKGIFNVPIGTKYKVILDNDDFECVSRLLKKVKLHCGDFENIIIMAKEGDFIFVDPPYTVMHNNNNFIKYNENLFSWADQVRLRDCLVKAKERGVLVLATNASHPLLMELYEQHFEIIKVMRNSVIAADSRNRNSIEEIIIKGNL